MTIMMIVLVVIVIIIAMDLTIKRVYRYTKKPHETTPAAVGVSFEEIRFPTRNNCTLFGWWIPKSPESHRPSTAVILAHGWGRNLERMLPYVQALHPMGYDLLAFDLRGHGSSDPDTYPNMLKFSQDIRAAVDFIMAQGTEQPARVGVLGLSVGGGAAIHAAATDERIQAAITVGAIAHPVDVMRLEFTKKRIPYFPVGWLMLKYLQVRISVNFNHIAPVNVISKTLARIFIVHGDRDTVVPVGEGERLLRAGARDTVQLWTVPERGHSDCHEHPEFWDRVGTFLSEAFTADSSIDYGGRAARRWKAGQAVFLEISDGTTDL